MNLIIALIAGLEWMKKAMNKYSDIEIETAKNLLEHGYKWIARNGSGSLFAYFEKPTKADTGWYSIWYPIENSGYVCKELVPIFQSVHFDDKEPPRTKTRVGDILEDNVDPKYTISDRLWAGHQHRKEYNKAHGKGFGYSLFTPDSPYTSTLSARYYKDGSEILIAQAGKNPRKLTPRECARLQGFPDAFIIPVSDARAYKQFGNSVAVPVIRAISRNIIKTMCTLNGNRHTERCQ